MLPAAAVTAAPSRNKQAKLEITRNAATGNITVSWNGKGVLKQSTTLGGHFKPVKSHGNSLTTAPEAEQMLYTIEAASSPIYSVNAVGYVNLQFPPGLSLIATPLLYYENTVEALLFNMPEGTQVYKYVPDFGYEVSSFDGAVWSNPDMDLSPGIGYFVLNPTSATLLNTYVGEVLQGVLVNNLPAGFSTEGALVPQQGSINDIHRIPGEPGDIIRLYVNNGQGGDYITSVFSGTDNAWLPDLTLGVAQGFVSEKQNAQDWIRVFSVIP
jgi:hypothetical protein